MFLIRLLAIIIYGKDNVERMVATYSRQHIEKIVEIWQAIIDYWKSHVGNVSPPELILLSRFLDLHLTI